MPHDEKEINRKTSYRLDGMAHYKESLKNLRKDKDREERYKHKLCLYCFHFRRYLVAGAAMTESDCKSCKISMLFGSTANDALCPKCSDFLECCIRCGADRELKIRK